MTAPSTTVVTIAASCSAGPNVRPDRADIEIGGIGVLAAPAVAAHTQ